MGLDIHFYQRAKSPKNALVEVMYFGKYYFLLDHFNITENHSTTGISAKQIKELNKLCKEVLDDHSKLNNLIPTTSKHYKIAKEEGDGIFARIENVYNQTKDVLSYIHPRSKLYLYCWW